MGLRWRELLGVVPVSRHRHAVPGVPRAPLRRIALLPVGRGAWASDRQRLREDYRDRGFRRAHRRHRSRGRVRRLADILYRQGRRQLGTVVTDFRRADSQVSPVTGGCTCRATTRTSSAGPSARSCRPGGPDGVHDRGPAQLQPPRGDPGLRRTDRRRGRRHDVDGRERARRDLGTRRSPLRHKADAPERGELLSEHLHGP